MTSGRWQMEWESSQVSSGSLVVGVEERKKKAIESGKSSLGL